MSAEHTSDYEQEVNKTAGQIVNSHGVLAQR